MDWIGHVYVINLDKDTGRMERIRENLSKYGIRYERFPAVYGKALPMETIQQHASWACRTFTCNRSIVGCAMSHRALWERISRGKEGVWHMVLEDDASFHDGSLGLLREMGDYIQSSGVTDAYINLSCATPCEIGCRNPPFAQQRSDEPLSPGFFAVGMTGYLLTPKAARVLLRNNPKIHYHIDAQAAVTSLLAGGTPYLVARDKVVTGWYGFSNNVDRSYEYLPILAMGLRTLGSDNAPWVLGMPQLPMGVSGTFPPLNGYALILLALLFWVRLGWTGSGWVRAYLLSECLAYLVNQSGT
jgi:GR25 family glycosyltransferase involved in LPS biosynthesis